MDPIAAIEQRLAPGSTVPVSHGTCPASPRYSWSKTNRPNGTSWWTTWPVRRKPNRPLARDWPLEATSHREADSFDRAIDLRMTRLRRKIEHDPAHPETIRVGYMFVAGGE
jgi:hypothetical protein